MLEGEMNDCDEVEAPKVNGCEGRFIACGGWGLFPLLAPNVAKRFAEGSPADPDISLRDAG